VGQSKTVTVGYRYYLGLHFGMCHGPVDSVEQIQVGERLAWSGNQTASGAISINSPDLFGGESKEGGIQGTLDVMMGEPTQGINSYLQAQQGSPQPAYRGLLGLVYRGGLISCNNPYVKPWAARVRRVLKGWHNDQVWYASKASINVGGGVTAANPAHIIYECLTNPSWGMGYPTSLIDNSSFQTAADAFFSEGLGLCIMWSQQDSLDNFIQLVLDHAGAVLSQDSGGGYFKLKALRGDYIPASLELYDDQNGKVITLEKIERTTYTENVNELAIQYIDATTGRNASIFVQNLSNVQAQGAVVSQTRQYPGIPNANLAARIGMRDLKATTSGLARITFVANRSAFALVPGDVIQFAWQPAGIVSISLRITRIDYGPLTSGLIRIEGIEDVFGLPATVYADPPPIAWQPPNFTPQPATSFEVAEVTYRDLHAVFGPNAIGSVGPTEGYIGAVATRPSNAVSFNYQLQTRSGTAAYTDRELGDWAPTGTLVNGISKTATSITLQAATDIDVIAVNTLAVLGTGTTAEIVQVTAVDLNTYTLTIKRGCVDTTPKAWAAGTRFTSYELHAAADEIEYTSGEVISARFVTITGTGKLAEGSAPVATVTMNQRAFRPYPPGLVRFNGQAWPTALENSVAVTWAHRDRLLQVDQVLDHEAASIGPEAGTTYRVRAFDADTNTQFLDQTTDGTLYAFNYAFPANLRVELRAVRDGLDSFQLHEHTFAFTPLSLPWTPQEAIGSLSHWFDSSETSSVVITSGKVSQWSDKTPNARHAVQANATYQPTYSTGYNGGAASLSFSNASLWADCPNFSELAIFIAFQRSGGSILFDFRDPALPNSAIWDNSRAGYGAAIRNTSNTQASGANVTLATTAAVSAWLFNGTARTIQQWFNGTAQTQGTLASGVFSIARVSIGGPGTAVGTLHYSGRVAEVIIVGSTPSTDLRQRIEGYLAWKWGTVNALPTTHPWKYQPPALDYVRASTGNATLAATATRT